MAHPPFPKPPTAGDLATVAGHIARIVREALDASPLSQRELAVRTGIPLATLNRHLMGRTPFGSLDLIAACRELGLRPGDVVDSAEEAAA